MSTPRRTHKAGIKPWQGGLRGETDCRECGDRGCAECDDRD